jgi:outer membrane protein
MKRSILLVSVLTAGLAVRAARAQEAVKVGFVDMQRALEETEDGRKARDRLKKELEAKQKEIGEREEELKKQIDDLQKKRTLLPADKVREKEEEIQKKMQETQGIFMRHQQALQQKEQEALAPIYERMQRIIYKMAASENFTMIMDRRAGIIFAKPHLDLTNELIRRFNSGEEAGGKGPPKGAPPLNPAPGGAVPKKGK